MEGITAISIFVPESLDIKRLEDFLDVFAAGIKVIPLWNVYYGEKEPVSIIRISTQKPQVVVLFLREFLRGIQGSVFCMIDDQGFLIAAGGIPSLGTSAEKSLGAGS